MSGDEDWNPDSVMSRQVLRTRRVVADQSPAQEAPTTVEPASTLDFTARLQAFSKHPSERTRACMAFLLTMDCVNPVQHRSFNKILEMMISFAGFDGNFATLGGKCVALASFFSIAEYIPLLLLLLIEVMRSGRTPVARIGAFSIFVVVTVIYATVVHFFIKSMVGVWLQF